MRTFWIVIASLVLLVLALFVAGSIIAYVKNYSNIIEWIKSWKVFQDEVKVVAQTTQALIKF